MKHVNVRRYLHYSTVWTVLNCMKGTLYTLIVTLNESGFLWKSRGPLLTHKHSGGSAGGLPSTRSHVIRRYRSRHPKPTCFSLHGIELRARKGTQMCKVVQFSTVISALSYTPAPFQGMVLQLFFCSPRLRVKTSVSRNTNKSVLTVVLYEAC